MCEVTNLPRLIATYTSPVQLLIYPTSVVCAVDLDYGFVSNVTHSLNPLVRNTHKLWFDGGGALCDNLIPQRDPVKPVWGPRSWGRGAAEPMQGVGCSCGNFHCHSILLRADSELGSLPSHSGQPTNQANQSYCGQWAKCNATVMNEIATKDKLTLKYRRDWGDLWVEKLLNWWLDSEPIQHSICAGLKWNVDFFLEWNGLMGNERVLWWNECVLNHCSSTIWNLIKTLLNKFKLPVG